MTKAETACGVRTGLHKKGKVENDKFHTKITSLKNETESACGVCTGLKQKTKRKNNPLQHNISEEKNLRRTHWPSNKKKL